MKFTSSQADQQMAQIAAEDSGPVGDRGKGRKEP